MPSLQDNIWEKALLIRQVEYRLLTLFQQGLINGTVHTCIGQELTGIAIGQYYLPGDYVFSNHRGHGHFLGIYNQLDAFIAELLGRDSGLCAGHGGSQHLAYQGFFSNGILGSTAPIAVGLAKAIKINQSNNISFLFIGDGALGQGVIYEALNLAAIYKLPLYVICEHNKIAQSTPTEPMIGGDLQQRVEGFGFNFVSSSTNFPEQHLATTEQAVQALRSGAKPVFHLVEMQRLMPHSKSDDTRDKFLLQDLWAQDPLNNWLEQLTTQQRETKLQQVTQIIDQAVDKALASDLAQVLSTPTQAQQVKLVKESFASEPSKLVYKLNQALSSALQQPDTLLFGEDIESPYGGAFKVSDKLSDLYPEQVFNTPISESAIIGLGIGLAMAGKRPIVEIMFGDFLTLGFDLLVNSAAKFTQLFAGQVTLPLLIRTPMGGRRGYGATHSQSLEKHFLGVPYLEVVACNYRQSQQTLYESIANISTPTIMIENKLDYTRINEPMKGYQLSKSNALWPCYLLTPLCQPAITVLCYGGMLKEVELAAVELLFNYEIALEIVCPTQLYPFDGELLNLSLNKTEKLLCVEEGSHFASFMSEAIATVAINEHYEIQRLAGDETIISAARNIEQQQLPDANKIVTFLLNWLK